jgi:hypothetical protein
MSTPSGVHSYGHKSKPDDGSKHPDTIGPGLEAVSGEGGSSPKVPAYTKGSDGHNKSVKRGDGTETRRGIKVVHKQSKVSQPKASKDTNALPKGDGLHCHDGKSVPKSVK